MASRVMAPKRERRSHVRAPEQVSLSIRDAGTALTTETKNLRASGVYCTLNRFIAPMSKLELQFELPNGARRVKVRCTGVVVRVEPVVVNVERGRYNIAIFFTELTERHRSAIGQFVRQRLGARTPTS